MTDETKAFYWVTIAILLLLATLEFGVPTLLGAIAP